jgi:hypothetical protein
VTAASAGTIDANGVTLGVEHFGDAAEPLVLLVGGRPCAPGPNVSATSSPGVGATSFATTYATPADRRPAMKRLFALPMPDWSDRAAVAERAARAAEILGDDPAVARTVAGRMWDRTPRTDSVVQMANQLGSVFAALDCKPSWRERLPELAVPALVVHGRHNRVAAAMLAL